MQRDSFHKNGAEEYVAATTEAPYRDVDQQKLRRIADQCLVDIGAKYEEDLIVKTSGVYLTSANGHKVMDWTSGQMSSLIGHNHPEIAQVITSHALYLDHLFSGMLSPPVIYLAQRLTSLLPPGLDKAFFLSTGAESNEAAIKMAKLFTGKFEVVGLGASWHGMTSQAIGVQYHYGRKGQGPMMPGMHMLPAPNAYRSVFRHPDGSYDWETELNYGWDLIDRASCGSLAACIVECVQSSGGMHVLPDGYLKSLKKHCEKRGMLLIVDEAQTGVGRCGKFCAFEYGEIVPDILTLSKTLGSGLALSAVVTSNEIERSCAARDFLFVTTHVNDPLPAAVGNKLLEVVVRDRLVENAAEVGEHLMGGLCKLQAQYGCIGDVRGRGLMCGIEIVTDRQTKTLDLRMAKKLAQKMYDLGLWANLASHASFGGVFRICPPIVSTKAQIDDGLRIMQRAFAATEGTQPLCEPVSQKGPI
ncbi:hypothetical protein Z517_03552 [Fonsecaea pedrosoi CBS 271.37]|uniref:2,2-dialkylglycine decarboxylase (Pyruvate) n=1 Tax=Fonsecaea pedrosoi CBS 271.37 TaxID=1442368 RepID=A0A0D2FCE8_9EURO|nr:uncharacterized protein Z517_03552 [Fonsecaea pedrosoi CBS 271.37]KIW84302.1 hypothetical protein Z517_03552 [Fonsecaea pedrosoi CBS 271.37]